MISQVQVRGPAGGNDEMIVLKNKSTDTVAIGGWMLVGSSQTGTGTTPPRATIPAGHTLAPGATYKFTHTTVAPPGDQTYGTGISDFGGIQIRNSAGDVIDAVGSVQLEGAGLAFHEPPNAGAGLPFPTPNGAPGDNLFIRKADGTQDTDNNALDFVFRPARRGRSPAPKTPTAWRRSPRSIRSAQRRRATGQSTSVRGIITGIDNLYGSNFDFVFKSDSGIWVQEATRDPQATTSNGIFIAGIRRDADNPAGVIGKEVTIEGRVETKFGQVQIVPPGVGTTNQNAVEVDLATVATTHSENNPLPAAVTIDRTLAENQGLTASTTARSRACGSGSEGIATGGGTTKFHDLFLEPGTTARRLFRQNDVAAENTPWYDAPAQIGVAPDGGAGNPADPRLPWHSATQIDLDLFDITRNVVGPLSFGFDFFKIMPQLPVPGRNDGEQPTIERGPINAAGVPTAPAQPANTVRVASFNVENYFPVGKVNDGHAVTEAEYAERPTRSCRRSGRLREPTWWPSRRSPSSATAPTP